jgi:hypothetical protein
VSKFHVPLCWLKKVIRQSGPRASGCLVMTELSICFRRVVRHPCQGDVVQVMPKCIPSASAPFLQASPKPNRFMPSLALLARI